MKLNKKKLIFILLEDFIEGYINYSLTILYKSEEFTKYKIIIIVTVSISLN